ncbi:hypothetical protein K2173_025942 [Erythroxylum novogranatense]|uniref:Uncharacterized protein n=1 Tax=Erythroxylum novogranatense TaxID=1862640 RepID=A0AAV8SHN5_9ROSI|nr:hypothetical protein K2173_025942 [Erythroxylum novogranatense]
MHKFNPKLDFAATMSALLGVSFPFGRCHTSGIGFQKGCSNLKRQALVDEYGIKFFETSAKTNLKVEEVFFSIARDINQRLVDTDSKAEPQTIKINQPDHVGTAGQIAQKSACCGS